MKVRLAAGVTKDFYEASTPEERLGAALLCPLYFVCCLWLRGGWLACARGLAVGRKEQLQGAAIFQRAGHGDLVGVFDVGAGRDAGGDARDAEVGEVGMGFIGEVAGGSFAFDGG